MSQGSSAHNNLPSQLTSFVGREAEISDILSLIGSSECRLLTLIGAGGVGKSRLALEVATRSLHAFPSGIFFVPLQPLTSHENIVPTIAACVGYQFQADNRGPKQQIIDYFSAKSILLIIDNFEHLLEGADFLSMLLRSAPKLKIVVTSREALNLSEEWQYPVKGLDTPLVNDPDLVQNFDAIRLFLDRARQVNPHRPLIEQMPDIVRICQIVDGLPLAIELASTWSKLLSCAEIADEIQRNIGILETFLRNVPARHRSMQAVFEWSWSLLSDDERRVLYRLSVFRGGFNRHAAEPVAGASLKVLSALVDKSLLAVTAADRYVLHELLRQFAEQQLESVGDFNTVQLSHSVYYLEFLAQREAEVKGARQQIALAEIRSEFENIRGAWRWAIEHRHYGTITRALDCLVIAAEMNYSLLEVQALLSEAIAALLGESDEVLKHLCYRFVVRRTHIDLLLGIDVLADHDFLEHVLLHMIEREDRFEIAWCLWTLGNHAYVKGDLVTFHDRFDACLKLRYLLDDDYYLAHTLVGIHAAYISQDQAERALESVQESVVLRRKIHDQHGLSYSLGILSLRLIHNGVFNEAERYTDEALTIQDAIGRTPFFPTLKAEKALLAFWRGELEAAIHYAEDGLDFARNQNYLNFRNLCLAVLSFVASISGDYGKGRELCNQAAEDLLNPMISVFVKWGRALADCGLGHTDIAWHSLLTCLRAANVGEKSPTFQRLCLPLAALLFKRAGDARQAVSLLGLFSVSSPDLVTWLYKWPLMADLESALKVELGQDVFTDVWHKGRSLDLDIAVQGLLVPGNVTSPPQGVVANKLLAEPLTPRQLEVLTLISDGLSNQEIADYLVVGLNTVATHNKNIYSKLGVNSRTQAVLQARKLGLL